MYITVLGSADMAAVPVHDCLCTLCRQARAVRHLRREPASLLIQHQGQRLLLDGSSSSLPRLMAQDPVNAVLLSSWSPARWRGLIHQHLGAGSETSVFGPELSDDLPWFEQHRGRLQPQAVLRPGREQLIGRFRVLPLAVGRDQTGESPCLAYGIRDGERLLAHLPAATDWNETSLSTIASWQPDLVIASCTTDGTPAQRLQRLNTLHQRLGQPNLLITGLDHHTDQWLQSTEPTLSNGMILARDRQRLDLSQLSECRRLASSA